MFKYKFKFIFIAFAVFSLGACAHKTAQNTAENRPAQQQNRPPQQGRGEGQRGQQGRPSFSDLLSRMDANKDGKLAQAEVQGPLKDNFTTIDTDKDGFISEAEFNNAPAPPQRGWN